MSDVRLQRYLAQAGVAARRKAEELIVAGRVTVNGKVVRELGSKVDPDKDRVAVDGTGVHPEEHFYILFNKPKACITAVSDDRGRMTVMDYLPNLPAHVAPVGRLDFYSEGVLLLTNDGELAARLLAPKQHVPKTYHVKVHGEVTGTDLEALRAGVRLDDGTVTQPADVATLPAESRHTWLAITLYEGKQRQIHRMLESRGHRVDKLQRVAFGNLTFHGLRVGDARELTQQELNELRDMVGLDHRAVSRGRWQARREDTDLARRRVTEPDEDAPPPEHRPQPPAQGWGLVPRRGQGGGPRRTAPAGAGDDRDGRGPRDRDAARSSPGRGFRDGAAPRDDRRPSAGARDDRRPSAGPRDDRRASFGREDRRPAAGPRDERRSSAGPRDDRRPSAGARDDRRASFGRDDRRPASGPRDERRSSAGPRDDRRASFGRDDRRASFGRDDRRPSAGSRDDRRASFGRDDRRPASGPRDDRRASAPRADRRPGAAAGGPRPGKGPGGPRPGKGPGASRPGKGPGKPGGGRRGPRVDSPRGRR